MLLSRLAQSTGGQNRLSGEPSGIGRGQENRNRRDVLRLSQSAQRSFRDHLLGEGAAAFHSAVLADKDITGKVPRKQIEHAFDLSRQLKNVDKIFTRVFGNHGPAATKAAKRKAH